MKKVWLIALILNVVFVDGKVDLIVFSKDRPLQLFAFLESSFKCLNGLGEVTVIYAASTDFFNEGYEECFNYFGKHGHVLAQKKQGANPKDDFKQLVIDTLIASRQSYILFGVDDIIVKDDVDLLGCIHALEEHNAYGFYLRLGENITSSYTENKENPLPAFESIGNDRYLWYFGQGTGEWNYPHTLDMTIYRRDDVLVAFRDLNFQAPNTLEAHWAGFVNPLRNSGICFKESKIVNVPLNLVQNEWPTSRHMNYSTEHLNSIFLCNLKIDISRYKDIPHRAPHAEIEPVFIMQ